MLGDAISLRASDIHVEPFEHELRIRYRIDGLLQEVPVPGADQALPAGDRFAHQDPLEPEHRREARAAGWPHQDPRERQRSGHPRLGHPDAARRSGRHASAAAGCRRDRARRAGHGGRASGELFERVLEMPHGIALVTGPTGSGKTTTLYSALHQINDAVRKIITIEDPVEYQLKGINQIQVAEKAGLTFARGLRAILRHDPDVVLIGEIRDQETAQIAVQASLTGHMVFSTLHTNDAPGALTRLVDMGVEPYLVASSLEAVIAQRLVRVLCAECKEDDTTARTTALRERVEALRDATDFPRRRLQELPHDRLHRPARDLRADDDEHADPRRFCCAADRAWRSRTPRGAKGMRALIEDGWRRGARRRHHAVAKCSAFPRTKAPTGFAVAHLTYAMPVFEYKALGANGAATEGRIEAGGRQDAARMHRRARADAGAAGRDGGSRASGAPDAASKLPQPAASRSLQVEESPLRGAGRFHALALQPARGERAAEPRADHSLQGNLAPGRGREVARTARSRDRRRAARRGDGRVAGCLPARLCRDGRGGRSGRLPRCGARRRSPTSRRGKRSCAARSSSAMMYPAVLLFLAIAVLIFLMVFFIPRFQTLFAGFDAALPLLTQVIVGISDVVRHYGFYLLAGIGGGDLLRPELVRAARAAGGSGSRGSCARRSSARSRRRSPWRAFAACSARCSAPAFR